MNEIIDTNTAKPVPVTDSKLLILLANFVSYVLHPVFMPLVMAYVIYSLAPVSFIGIPDKQLAQWFLTIALNTVFFPLLIVFLTKRLGFIESIHMRSSKDRIIPLIAIMIFYFWAYMLFKNFNSPYLLKVLFLGNFIGIIVLFMVNIFVKMSMHTMAAGGMLGIIIVLMIESPVNMAVPLFIALVLAGLIGTARMLLGAHRPAEIWIGYILGILVQLGAYAYL